MKNRFNVHKAIEAALDTKYLTLFLATLVCLLIFAGIKAASATGPSATPPAGDVTPNFSGLNVSGNTTMNGTLSVRQKVTGLGAEALKTGDLSVQGELSTQSLSSPIIKGNTHIEGNLEVDGDYESDILFNDSIHIVASNPVEGFDGGLIVDGDSTFAGVLDPKRGISRNGNTDGWYSFTGTKVSASKCKITITKPSGSTKDLVVNKNAFPVLGYNYTGQSQKLDLDEDTIDDSMVRINFYEPPAAADPYYADHIETFGEMCEIFPSSINFKSPLMVRDDLAIISDYSSISLLGDGQALKVTPYGINTLGGVQTLNIQDNPETTYGTVNIGGPQAQLKHIYLNGDWLHTNGVQITNDNGAVTFNDIVDITGSLQVDTIRASGDGTMVDITDSLDVDGNINASSMDIDGHVDANSMAVGGHVDASSMDVDGHLSATSFGGVILHSESKSIPARSSDTLEVGCPVADQILLNGTKYFNNVYTAVPEISLSGLNFVHATATNSSGSDKTLQVFVFCLDPTQ